MLISSIETYNSKSGVYLNPDVRYTIGEAGESPALSRNGNAKRSVNSPQLSAQEQKLIAGC